MPKIKQLIEQHPKEWLAIAVTAEQDGRPAGGELVYHSKDRAEVWRKTKDQKRLYIIYAGPALEKGYVAAF